MQQLSNSRPYKLTPSQTTCGGLPISEMFTNTPTTTNIINLWNNTHCGIRWGLEPSSLGFQNSLALNRRA